MLCTLQRVEIRPRVGKLPFYICTWNGVLGDPNAPLFIKGADGSMKVNTAAAKARNITLTKSIFPVDDTTLAGWWDLFKGAPVVVIPKKGADGSYMVDDSGTYVTEETVNSNPTKITLNLVYVQVPLNDIVDDCKAIRYTDSKGIEHTQTYITVIGFADDNNVWCEDSTPRETALRNYLTNVASGVYECLDDEEASTTSTTTSNNPTPTTAPVQPQTVKPLPF